MTTGRIPKRHITVLIEEEDYLVLGLAGWRFSKEIGEYCHASADIYRRMIGRPALERIINQVRTTSDRQEE